MVWMFYLEVQVHGCVIFIDLLVHLYKDPDFMKCSQLAELP